MAIQITINGSLTLDQSASLQTPATTDTGNDATLTFGGLAADPLGSATIDTAMLTYVNGLGLSLSQKAYAFAVGAASSGDNFITVATNGESVDNLFFSDANGDPLNGDAIAG